VCGNANGTHGVLSNNYKVIGSGVYHVAPDGVKRLDKSKTMKPLLLQLFLQFDRKLDCLPYGDGFLVNRG
jgi:hypothetical protein